MSARNRLIAAAIVLVAGVIIAVAVLRSNGPEGGSSEGDGPGANSDKVSGQAPFRFELVMTRDALPEKVFETNPFDKEGRSILESAHGGFALDYREGQGEVYFFLQGAGILRIDAGVTKVELLPTPQKMVKQNLHNATFFIHDGTPMIAWPANLGRKVFVTDLQGKILHEIGMPEVDPYQGGGIKYKPTDTEYLDGKLWVTDGYGSHYVMSYDLAAEQWTGTIFAGTSRKPEKEKIRNPHGITIYEGMIYISGRWYARIHEFKPDTTFVDFFELPRGSKPCDFEFFVQDDALYGVASSLEVAKGSDHAGASIYIVDMKTHDVVSELVPKDDMGLDVFDHHHNTLPRVVDGVVYLYDQSWKNGDFAIYRQVSDG